MKGPSYPLELVTTKVGGMKAAFKNYRFEFHFNRSGNKFWRCLSHANGCTAKIMSKGSIVFEINAEHNHEIDPIIFVNTAALVPSKSVLMPMKTMETIAATVKQPAVYLDPDLKEKMKKRLANLGKKI